MVAARVLLQADLVQTLNMAVVEVLEVLQEAPRVATQILKKEVAHYMVQEVGEEPVVKAHLTAAEPEEPGVNMPSAEGVLLEQAEQAQLRVL